MTPEVKKSLWIQLGVGATAAVVVGYETFKHWIQQSPSDPTVANPYPKMITLPNAATNGNAISATVKFPIKTNKVHFGKWEWSALELNPGNPQVGGVNITEARAIRDAHTAIDAYLNNAANAANIPNLMRV